MGRHEAAFVAVRAGRSVDIDVVPEGDDAGPLSSRRCFADHEACLSAA
jgi:hypothetical protein